MRPCMRYTRSMRWQIDCPGGCLVLRNRHGFLWRLGWCQPGIAGKSAQGWSEPHAPPRKLLALRLNPKTFEASAAREMALVWQSKHALQLERSSALKVFVRDNNVDQALRVLKRKLQREGLFREIKRRRAYEKPSEKRVREKREGIRRGIKAARKLAQREGLLPKPRSKRPAFGR
jgi:small subunit ribosomal protein S21